MSKKRAVTVHVGCKKNNSHTRFRLVAHTCTTNSDRPHNQVIELTSESVYVTVLEGQRNPTAEDLGYC
ncbi:hypothetical protein ATANTOWER_024954 [Ataeniobius toweri]|uniref:Ribosomal protein L33 n=1 Tax=Ataeniobius toweri TaxID=208326 RepID=A0ABU7BJ73_9TELE|nr:hypothetical protein [Ataeniobius toweri]